jgi:type II secretory pathway pseudopilin PulG
MIERTGKPSRRPRCGAAFTLIELIVVIGIIVLIAGIALPSLTGLMTAGGDSQAYNLLLGQLTAARAHAMTNGRHTCVHMQLNEENRCYSTVLEYDPSILDFDSSYGVQFTQDGTAAYFDATGAGTNTVDSTDANWTDDEWKGFFVRVMNGNANDQSKVYVVSANSADQLTVTPNWDGSPGAGDLIRIYKPLPFVPRKLPGAFAFGKLTDTFVSGAQFQGLDDAGLEDFTTINVIFSPDGRVVQQVDGSDIRMEEFNGLFFNGATPSNRELWSRPPAEPGVTAVTLFDYAELSGAPADDRPAYLDERGQFLPINPYTGRLFPRK